ncbi:MAG: hypothetical protein NXY59_02875 [Aigarchaeota archaeon]|nr:hypothetical protein [Candidatus Pelearchaeum maunauluense]
MIKVIRKGRVLEKVLARTPKEAASKILGINPAKLKLIKKTERDDYVLDSKGKN